MPSLFNTLINNLVYFVFRAFKVTLLLLLPTVTLNASTDKSIVYQIDIREEITPGTARKVSVALKKAESAKADYLLIHLNTYGGLLDAADSIRTTLLNSRIPVIVFIDNNAASAGALISIACNKIYMRKGGSIGAATVVNQNTEALPDKYQSYMRSMMRSTAEARGRDARIAEAMVDARISIPGINDSGKVLTLTGSEALALNYCDGLAENIPEVLKLEGLSNYEIVRFEPGWMDILIGWLIHPAVSGVLILLILGGLYYELQQPGIGFPLVISVTAAILYFAPLYLEGLAENWEILLSIVGIVLIAVELFVIPGFGVAGISGLILLVSGLTLSLLRNDGLDFTGISGTAIASSIATVLAGTASSLLLFLFASKVITQSPLTRKMILSTALASGKEATDSMQVMPAVGERGHSISLLRPAGKIRIGDIVYSATCESGFIEAGLEVEITAVNGLHVTVRPVGGQA